MSYPRQIQIFAIPLYREAIPVGGILGILTKKEKELQTLAQGDTTFILRRLKELLVEIL